MDGAYKIHVDESLFDVENCPLANGDSSVPRTRVLLGNTSMDRCALLSAYVRTFRQRV